MTGDTQDDTTQNSTSQRSAGPRWDPRIAVLSRPDGRLQLGWTPGRAVLLTLPVGVDRARGEVDPPQNGRLQIPRDHPVGSIDARDFDVGDGEVARATRRFRIRPHCRQEHRVRPDPTVSVHSRTPSSAPWSPAGYSTRRSRGYRNTDVVRTWNEQLVVLADDVVTDPRLVSDLVRCGLPHLSVRIRDGNGVIGPLVVPGQSSCLRCADIIRSELDPHWLHLSAQLLGSAGHAESAMIHASVALALAEIDSALSETAATYAASLSSTLEIALRPYRITTRRWPRQISCSCQYLAPVSGKGRPSQT